MKKLINHIDDIVKEQLEGMALAHPELRIATNPHYIVRSDAPVQGKVALISGGGSGHEPLHGGYVGLGMLDGACPGEIFSAPTPDQMVACGKIVEAGAGILFIVKNYTGDVLSFETAVELLHEEGLQICNVLIDDDVSLQDGHLGAGRRGMGTTLVVEKIVGAAAQHGYSLEQCVELAHEVVANGWSIGTALTSCVVPYKGSPTFELGDDQIEIGIGIHGEAGQSRIGYLTADEVTHILTEKIIKSRVYARRMREWNREIGDWMEIELVTHPLQAGDQVIAIVNNMGGTPLSELYIVFRKLTQICAEHSIRIVRNLVGTYVTSLDMQGCSITLVRVNEKLLRFWDAPVKTAALNWRV